jgi:RND family efflux transporter MFP subunit
VIHVSRGSAQATLVLPGTMQAITEAPILARADGYLKRRLADLGDRVHAGQALAEIDAPELDQQIQQADAAVEQAQAAVEQAQANLAQGKANRDLARITAERLTTLNERGITPQQDRDQAQAQLAAQRSNLAAARANAVRLRAVDGYRLVTAPFDGVITQRNVDVGALVSTGNTLLYRIAQTGTLRTYVNVPQGSVSAVHVGQEAALRLADFPGRTFTGKVARMARALDPSSRTMLVEVDVPNADGSLLAGSFADVELIGSRANPPIVVPASTLVFRADGAQLAVVRSDNTVHLQKVTVGRDYGDRLEILGGVDEGTTILAVAGDTAREGAKVVPFDREGQP